MKPDKVEIIADHREEASQILEHLRNAGALVRVEQLPVADFIISERAAVERKERGDFESSVMDGRLFAQVSNMVVNFPRSIVIIEGEREEERLKRNSFLGAICSLILDYGVSVFFTRDTEATAELIYALAKREQLGEKREVRLLGVKRAFTLAQQQQLLIESLPGVGPKLAKSLLRDFGSPERIFRAGEKKLQEVEKIGPEKAKAIKRVLSAAFAPED